LYETYTEYVENPIKAFPSPKKRFGGRENACFFDYDSGINFD
jgi:hypothetical protein